MCCGQSREINDANIIEAGKAVIFSSLKKLPINIKGCNTTNVYHFEKDKKVAVHINDADCLKKIWFLEQIE